MLLAIAIVLSLLGSPRYTTRETTARWIARTWPLSAPVVAFGHADESLEVRLRCQRIWELGAWRIQVWQWRLMAIKGSHYSPRMHVSAEWGTCTIACPVCHAWDCKYDPLK